MSTIGPKPSTGSESIMEEFVDGIHRNKAYLVRLLVYYRELGEEAVINITRRSIGELYNYTLWLAAAVCSR